MNRRRIAPLLSQEEDTFQEEKPFKKVNITKQKKNLPVKKIIVVAAILGLGAYYFNNSSDINNNILKATGLKDDTKIVMPSFDAKEESTPQQEASKMATDMQKVMANKDLKEEQPKENIDSEFPVVNISTSNQNNNLSANNDSSTPTATKETPSNENTSNKSTLERELNMLLKNSTFSINAKKDSISLFISNMNYNVGEFILNNNKFKLSNITMKCENNKMPTFTIDISDSSTNEVLLSKNVNYSDNKKIILAFDSLSITDLGSNTENIYLPDEAIFKGFSLKNISDNKSSLLFDFSCDGKNISIEGKELSTIQ